MPDIYIIIQGEGIKSFYHRSPVLHKLETILNEWW